jgi:hypothetical protein
VKRLAALAVVALLTACGGGKQAATTAPTGPEARTDQTTLYTANGWTVVLRHKKALLYHYVGEKWVVDRSKAVKIRILGPDPNEVAPNPPQVAIAMRSAQPLVESALWVDDLHLFEKGGGSPTNGTIYGAPANALDPGTHTAVGYARTASGGSVVAWTFTVK